MDEVVAFDQSLSLDDFLQPAERNGTGTEGGKEVVTFPGNIRKKV